MNKKDALKNIRLYRLYVTFGEPLLWGPILISCLTHLGKMKLSEIYFMESVVLLGTIFLQIPTGALADLIGRKKTIIFGTGLMAVSIIWFALIKSPLGVWGSNITCMIGLTLCSGADSAFLYDTLKAINRESEYKKIDGQAMGNRLIIVAFCSILVGYLAQFSLRVPLILSVPGVLFAFIVTFFFKEPPLTKKYSVKEQVCLMKNSLLFVARHKEVKWIIVFTTLIGVTSKIWFFTYNPYFELVKLNLQYYGYIFFVLNLVAWFFSRYAQPISERIKEKRAMILMVLLIGLPIIIMGSLISIISVVLVFPQNIVRGFMRPFFGELLNRHLNSENRATVLSVQSAVSGLAQFVALGGFGFLLISWGLPFCLQILGAAVILLGGLMIFRYKKVFT
ncbi:MAG: MFS transporter [Candidatus Falkowbacteria bacterium]|nr:MFS transporter [Candidatus Falkowbacteria bacterium]